MEEKRAARPKAAKFGPFTLLRKLGEGGMGMVYLALAESPFGSERVALKVLPAKEARDPEARRRFEREARTLAVFSHVNIIRGREFGAIRDALYMTMEYVDGPSLADLIESKKGLGEMATLDVAVQMTRALQELYNKGFVHRDVNPANILIDREGVAKLMDFGLAVEDHGRSDQITQLGIVVGTPHVMAPERIHQQRDLDIRSDIYSLGITLYAVATGRAPFGEDPASIFDGHVSRTVKSPGELVSMSPKTEQIILRMLSKNREERYSTPTEILEALSQATVEVCTDPVAGKGRTLKKIVREYLAQEEGQASGEKNGRGEESVGRA